MEEIIKIADRVRLDFESNCDEGNLDELNNTCHLMTQKLLDSLLNAGHPAQRIVGMYLGADDDYEPDTDEWDDDDIENYDREAGFCHWWIVVGDKIVDICVDQFHPSYRNEYRLAVVDKDDYRYAPLDCQPSPEVKRNASKNAM